ncbi:MAG: GIY-YIG nuclease family protein [Cyanobacteriota bacterium]
MQYIGYSRDITASLLQHLVRVPQGCYWVKVWTCDRPSRTLLETVRSEWIAESGATPPGNGDDEARWNQPIDAKVCMTPQEQASYASADDQGIRLPVESAIAKGCLLEALTRRGFC